MRKNILIIHNPTAGRRKRRYLHQVIASLEALGCHVVLRDTTGPGDAERLALAADPAEIDMVVAAGGDGTVNEVVNGLAKKQGRDGPGIPLGVIPVGTANVFALELSLPTAPAALAETIARGRIIPFHPGRAGNRYFAQMASLGFDSLVVRTVPLRLKALLGKAAYLLQALRLWYGWSERRITLAVDGAVATGCSVIVAKGKRYAGNHICAPEADLSAPSFQVCLFTRGGRFDLLRYAFGLLTRNLANFRGVRLLSAREVHILDADSLPVQVDGDPLMEQPDKFDILPEPLAVISGKLPRDP